jgi:hypothetical protein
MNCRRARNLLTRTADRAAAADPALARHLAACAECARFAERWAAVRRGIEGRLTRVTPDAGFAARVTARLGAPADPFTWAAWRLLPATVALTLVLGGWCLLWTPAPSSLAEQLADGDLLAWVTSTGGDER